MAAVVQRAIWAAFLVLPVWDTAFGADTAAADLPDLIERIEPAVVRLSIDTPDGAVIGSGYLVDDRGTVATNCHVIEGASRGTAATADGKEFRIEGVLNTVPRKDIAFIRLAKPYPKLAIPIAKQLPRKGERVVAFGAPKGFGFTTSDGIVSAIRSGNELRELAPSMNIDVEDWDQEYDPNATWVQLTAPISPGNSGGPLVSMKGEVVGMNTWCRLEGQNLNFAISCVDILAALEKAGDKLTPFHAIPRVAPPPVAGRPARPAPLPQGGQSFGKIELPSGLIVNDSQVAFPGERVKELFDGNPTAMVAKDDKERVRVLVCQNRGQLHGPAVSFYEDGSPQSVGHYDDMRRQGEFFVWHENGFRHLYATYKRDKKHGIYCVFQDDMPHLIVECELGEARGIHLVKFNGGRAEIDSFDTLDAASKDDRAKEALADLASLDADLEKGEKQLRQMTRKLYDRYHAYEVRIVRAKTHDARRAAQRNRDAAITAMGNAVHNAVMAASARMHGN
jgi:S1-C subfamily serine protease